MLPPQERLIWNSNWHLNSHQYLLSLAKLDETLNKTAKSQLIGELMEPVEVSSSLPDTGADGMALIQMRQDAGA